MPRGIYLRLFTKPTPYLIPAVIAIASPLIYTLTSTRSTSFNSTRNMSAPANPKSSPDTPSFQTTRYHPRHTSWPHTPQDFTREDPTPDEGFYSTPRFVTHIDDHAIAALRTYYAGVLPRRGKLLDLCSSWISHFPGEVEDAAVEGKELEVVGVGMNARELERNGVLARRVVWDLNARPGLPDEVLAPTVGEQGGERGGRGFDATVCVVSIDYLTQPREVLESVREKTNVGGTVHLVVSNRCFPTKAVRRWLRVGERERLNMVGDYLWWSGWREVEIVEVCDGKVRDGVAGEGALGQVMGMMGLERGCDPLWVVRGSKVEAEGG